MTAILKLGGILKFWPLLPQIWIFTLMKLNLSSDSDEFGLKSDPDDLKFEIRLL